MNTLEDHFRAAGLVEATSNAWGVPAATARHQAAPRCIPFRAAPPAAPAGLNGSDPALDAALELELAFVPTPPSTPPGGNHLASGDSPPTDGNVLLALVGQFPNVRCSIIHTFWISALQLLRDMLQRYHAVLVLSSPADSWKSRLTRACCRPAPPAAAVCCAGLEAARLLHHRLAACWLQPCLLPGAVLAQP